MVIKLNKRSQNQIVFKDEFYEHSNKNINFLELFQNIEWEGALALRLAFGLALSWHQGKNRHYREKKQIELYPW